MGVSDSQGKEWNTKRGHCRLHLISTSKMHIICGRSSDTTSKLTMLVMQYEISFFPWCRNKPKMLLKRVNHARNHVFCLRIIITKDCCNILDWDKSVNPMAFRLNVIRSWNAICLKISKVGQINARNKLQAFCAKEHHFPNHLCRATGELRHVLNKLVFMIGILWVFQSWRWLSWHSRWSIKKKIEVVEADEWLALSRLVLTFLCQVVLQFIYCVHCRVLQWTQGILTQLSRQKWSLVQYYAPQGL
jgi:hypothetical protein